MRDCVLLFTASTAPAKDPAERLARGLPGYTTAGVGKQRRCAVRVSGLPREQIQRLQELLLVVADRPGTSLCIDGADAGPEALWELLRLLACRRDRAMNADDRERCWGLPEPYRGRVPCRLINRRLPAKPADEYGDPDRLRALMAQHERESLADLCPAYARDEVLAAALARFVDRRQPVA